MFWKVVGKSLRAKVGSSSSSGFLEEEVLDSGQQGQPSSGTCGEAVDLMVMSTGLGGQRGPVQIPALLFAAVQPWKNNMTFLSLDFLICTMG